MPRSGLVLTAVATSLLGALALCGAGWFDPPPPRTDPNVLADSADSPRQPTVVRYRHGELKHWRACLLNH
jgi:hypothetical protein